MPAAGSSPRRRATKRRTRPPPISPDDPVTTWAQDVIAGRVVAGPRVKKAWRHNPGDLAKAAYYAVPVRAKLEYTALYLGLAALHALTVQGVPEMLVPG